MLFPYIDICSSYEIVHGRITKQKSCLGHIITLPTPPPKKIYIYATDALKHTL